MTPGMQSAIGIMPSEELYALLLARAEKDGMTPSALALDLVQIGLECRRMHGEKLKSPRRRKP